MASFEEEMAVRRKLFYAVDEQRKRVEAARKVAAEVERSNPRQAGVARRVLDVEKAKFDILYRQQQTQDLADARERLQRGRANVAYTRSLGQRVDPEEEQLVQEMEYQVAKLEAALQTGPRGGQFTITASGEKHYVGRNPHADEHQTRGKGPWKK